MPNSLPPIEINLSTVLACCDCHTRDAVLALLERGGDLTLAEIAEVIGTDTNELIRQLVGYLIADEALRLLEAEADENRGRAN
ncbi:MarR family transcriptional regulator [Shinella pollutisoli]|uniref:MarR family transcriptional regulator n=1 Tax=Shinella pollutisoli TaxID=2250594 RepID=A0ABV7DGX6_9HYPH|nr:helix-turn-helix domain-containing protein [Shinella pollutisoli]